jgi:hypothetical protein
MFYCFIVSVQDTFGYALKFWMPPRAIVETAASAQISTIVLERPRLSHSVFISTTKAYTSNRHCVSRSLRESHFNSRNCSTKVTDYLRTGTVSGERVVC